MFLRVARKDTRPPHLDNDQVNVVVFVYFERSPQLLLDLLLAGLGPVPLEQAGLRDPGSHDGAPGRGHAGGDVASCLVDLINLERRVQTSSAGGRHTSPPPPGSRANLRRTCSPWAACPRGTRRRRSASRLPPPGRTPPPAGARPRGARPRTRGSTCPPWRSRAAPA